MIDELKKQLAAISGEKVTEINFFKPDLDGSDAELKDPGYIRQIENYHKDPNNFTFGMAEGDYPFYYKGKTGTLVGRVKGNQVVDVKTFTNENSKMTIQEFAKGRIGDAYRLEKNGKGIYNLSLDAHEGYNFLNFEEPTKAQLASSKAGYLFGTSSLEEMDAAFKDRSSIEALNYLGVELNAYKTGAMLKGNGQVTFHPSRAEKVKLSSNKPISGNVLIESMNSTGGSSLSSNQSIGSYGGGTVRNLASNTLDSNGSLTGKVAKLLKKVF